MKTLLAASILALSACAAPYDPIRSTLDECKRAEIRASCLGARPELGRECDYLAVQNSFVPERNIAPECRGVRMRRPKA